MKHLKHILILLSIAILSGCEYTAQYTYTIANGTNEKLKVIYCRASTGTDVTIDLDPNATQKIFMVGHGISRVKDINANKAAIQDITKFVAFRSDTAQSKSNFLSPAKWVYSKHGSHSADYTTTISLSDF
jgi:hypothetical protein